MKNKRKPIYLTLCLTIFVCAYAGEPGEGRGSQKWSYEGATGPANWEMLDPSFSNCGEGVSQSPVDIQTGFSEEADLPSLIMRYDDDAVLDVVHKGYTVKAIVKPGKSNLIVGGVPHRLLQFHFHTPSEHLVDGVEAPLEMHLVHEGKGGQMVVLAIFIQIDEASHFELGKIFSKLPSEEGRNVHFGDYDLANLCPRRLNAYTYIGSLTTPPCSEGVRWFVLEEPLELSEDHVQGFMDLFSGAAFPDGNRRPVQPLDNRVVESKGE